VDVKIHPPTPTVPIASLSISVALSLDHLQARRPPHQDRIHQCPEHSRHSQVLIVEALLLKDPAGDGIYQDHYHLHWRSVGSRSQLPPLPLTHVARIGDLFMGRVLVTLNNFAFSASLWRI